MARRRAKGEGTFEVSPTGKVRLVRTSQGQRQKGPWQDTKQSARAAWIDKFEREPKRSAVADQLPIRELILQWFPEEGETRNLRALAYRSQVSPNTWQTKRYQLLAVAADRIADMSFQELSQLELQEYVNRWKGKPRTIVNYVNDLRHFAKLNGFELPEVKFPVVRLPESKIIQPSEWAEFYATATNDQERIAWGLLYRCGMRPNEVCAARREDYELGELWIHASVVRVGSKPIYRNSTKTGRDRRVPVQWRPLRELIESAPPGYLVHAGDPCLPMTAHSLLRRLQSRIADTKFRGLTLQALRRSAATAFAVSGVPLHHAEMIMGHSSKMLLQVYARAGKHDREEIMRRAFGE